MTRLSSIMAWRYKWVFPTALFGWTAMMMVVFTIGFIRKQEYWGILAVLAFFWAIAGYGCYVMKRYLFDLADEVWDDDTTLLVKRGRLQERIPLADVIDFRYDGVQNPSRVTLLLRKSSAFGTEIAFVPTYRMDRMFPLETPQELRDLLDRADAARRNLTQDALGEQ